MLIRQVGGNMTFLNKYKYTIIFLIVLTIGGLMLNANYYINKRPVTMENRVYQEEGQISFLEYTRVLEVGKHTEENVLLGFHPDFEWGEELSYELSSEELKSVTFENIPNFEYGSVTYEIQPKGEGVGISFSVDSSNIGSLYRLAYYADVEVTEYVVDVYSVFGRYEYSFKKYSNSVIQDTEVLSVINETDAKAQGLE